MPNTDNLFDSFGAEHIQELNRCGNPILARGAFGDISLALLLRPKLEVVAIKTIQGAVTSDNKLHVDVFHEITAVRQLKNDHHPNIVRLLALYAKDDTSVSLAFEYCPVDLHLVLQWRRRRRKHPRLLAFDMIRTIAKDIFQALSFCHEKGFVHGDVKPGNLLVSSDGYIRLCDFGLAQPIADGAVSANQESPKGLCTLFYRAPESLLGDFHNRNPAVDIYAAGLVLAELCLGRTLWEGINEIDQLGLIFRFLGSPSENHWPRALQLVEKQQYGRLPFASSSPQPWSSFVPRVTESPHLEDLLKLTVALDPNNRIPAKDVIQHVWFCDEAFAKRAAVLYELVPDELDAPFFLSSNDTLPLMENEVPIRQILGLATCRKVFLSQFETWAH